MFNGITNRNQEWNATTGKLREMEKYLDQLKNGRRLLSIWNKVTVYMLRRYDVIGMEIVLKCCF